MPHLILARVALTDIDRCRVFLAAKSPQAASRAVAAIKKSLILLTTTPEIGRPCPEFDGARDLVIPYGDAGYIARYIFDVQTDSVQVIALWHQREAGF